MENRLVKDLQDNKYILVQNDIEVNEILESIGLKKYEYRCLLVMLDSSGSEFREIWGVDGLPYLDTYAECLKEIA